MKLVNKIIVDKIKLFHKIKSIIKTIAEKNIKDNNYFPSILYNKYYRRYFPNAELINLYIIVHKTSLFSIKDLNKLGGFKLRGYLPYYRLTIKESINQILTSLIEVYYKDRKEIYSLEETKVDNINVYLMENEIDISRKYILENVDNVNPPRIKLNDKNYTINDYYDELLMINGFLNSENFIFMKFLYFDNDIMKGMI